MALRGFPVFTGSNLESWIEWLEEYFVLHHFTDDDKLNLSQALMEGDAYEWFHRHESFQSWNEMKRELRFRFESQPRRNFSPQHIEAIQRNLVSMLQRNLVPMLQESLATLTTKIARIVDRGALEQAPQRHVADAEKSVEDDWASAMGNSEHTPQPQAADSARVLQDLQMETPPLLQRTSIPEVTICKPTGVLLDTGEGYVEQSVVTNTIAHNNAHQVFDVMPVRRNKQKRVKVLSDKQRKRVKLSVWFKRIKVKIKVKIKWKAKSELCNRSVEDSELEEVSALQNQIENVSMSLSAEMEETNTIRKELDDFTLSLKKREETAERGSLEKEEIVRRLVEISGVLAEGVEHHTSSAINLIVDRSFDKIKKQIRNSSDSSYGNKELFERFQSLLYMRNLDLSLCKETLGEEVLVSLQVRNLSNELKVASQELAFVKEEKSALETDLARSEEKSVLLREKVSMAIKKGKGLVQDRDKFKTPLAEKKSEIEKLRLELQQLVDMVDAYTNRIDMLSIDLERTQELETERVALKDKRDQLKQSLSLNDTLLQKVMQSADIITVPIDFASEDPSEKIDRLKQEVYAAREKNRIYIPKDRYLLEEAEKKAMAEKRERLELQSESKDKRVVELHELYNSQQLLTAELSENLEKTEKKLEETEHSLFDLEEKYRQANVTIKEKEFVISNLLKSEKSLVERAFQLRTELESAASDVSNLFSKIERKEKIEDGNRYLIQKFQSHLTQQLELLHKTVASSVTQQEVQLKHMEEDMESFVSTKSEATEELRGRLSKLKTVYGSGIEALDNIAVKLDGNSQSTFGSLNSEVSKHSHELENVFKGFASEADMLLQDLQSSLNKQEEKLITFAQQQRKAHSRAVDTARSVSKVTVEFFKTLDTHATKLTGIVEEAQTVNHKKLSEFENMFEECAANEERQLLEKVAELLANSNARKKNLVQMAVHDLRESASTRTTTLQHEMSTMQDSTSSIKAEWNLHMEKTESSYHEDTSAVESGKKAMQEVLLNCLEKAEMSAHQWRKAQESLVSLERNNVASVDSIVRGGMDANENLRSQFSSAVSSSLDVFDAANDSLLTSIDHSLQLDNNACAKVNSMIMPCCEDLIELKSDHNHKIVEITENAGKCLLDEYVVDEPSCSTPRKRPIDIPSIESIEELRTPASEELLRAFRDEKLLKQANGDAKQQQQQQQHHLIRAPSLYEAAVSDSRFPLSAVN